MIEYDRLCLFVYASTTLQELFDTELVVTVSVIIVVYCWF